MLNISSVVYLTYCLRVHLAKCIFVFFILFLIELRCFAVDCGISLYILDIIFFFRYITCKYPHSVGCLFTCLTVPLTYKRFWCHPAHFTFCDGCRHCFLCFWWCLFKKSLPRNFRQFNLGIVWSYSLGLDTFGNPQSSTTCFCVCIPHFSSQYHLLKRMSFY